MMKIIIISFIISTLLLGSSVVLASSNSTQEEDEEVRDPISGSSTENTDYDLIDTFDSGMVREISIVLTWDDSEDDVGILNTNRPDFFNLSVTSPSGELTGSNTKTSSGTSSLTLIVPEDSMEPPGIWTITVYCGDCGDVYGPAGVRVVKTDTGNNWKLQLKYKYEVGSAGGQPMMGPPAYIQELLDHPIFKIHIFLMILSTFMFLFTGLFAGGYLFTKSRPQHISNPFINLIKTPKLYLVTAGCVFIAFFIASVPIGMWVAGKYYGWSLAWSGMPAFWNADAWKMTNADNVSMLTLIFWILPLYINRRDVMNSKIFMKLFGWSTWIKKKAKSAPTPKLTDRELALIYLILGIFVFTVLAVQPHG